MLGECSPRILGDSCSPRMHELSQHGSRTWTPGRLEHAAALSDSRAAGHPRAQGAAKPAKCKTPPFSALHAALACGEHRKMTPATRATFSENQVEKWLHLSKNHAFLHGKMARCKRRNCRLLLASLAPAHHMHATLIQMITMCARDLHTVWACPT